MCRYLECRLGDFEVLDQRLKTRVTKESQMESLDQMFNHAGKMPVLARMLITNWLSQVQRLVNHWLAIDTSFPLQESVAKAITFLDDEKLDDEKLGDERLER